MKSLCRCRSVRPLTPNYHPPSRLYRGNFDLQCFRNRATGLIYVSSKPLDLHPNAPATKAINKLMKATTGQLQMYDVIYNRKQTRSRGLTLFLIVDFANTERQSAQLQPLPPQTRESIDSENKAEAYDEPPAEETPDTDSPELPPELQPVLQESGLPGPSKDLSGTVHYGSDFDLDALDLKNAPDFDPDQDGEAQFYVNDAINAWIKADHEECAEGAKLRLYKSLDISKDHLGGSNPKDHSSWTLTPNLLIYQIPSAKSDDDFIRMCQDYAYMTSHEEYQRTRCFRQDDTSIPRWLLVQEFGGLYVDRAYLALKKKEAEYLWRKNGWEGVMVEFFRARG